MLYRSQKIKSKKFLALLMLLCAVFLMTPHSLNANHHSGGDSNAAAAGIATMLYYVLGFIVSSMGALASMLDTVLSIGATNSAGQPIPMVATTWGLVRNFSNMFFIIGLIVMAFATIFDISKYNFRTLIVKFLIAALMINFSLTIGTTIIDWTQSLSEVFLNAIGSYGNVLGGELDPAKLLGEPDTTLTSKLRPILARFGTLGAVGVFLTFAADQITWLQVMQMFFSIILGSIIVWSLLIGVIFTTIRIPVLWGLLILAPAAWVCSIFPTLIDTNRKWWHYFLGWNFFLPIYLFFLYIGLYFITNQDTVIGSVAPALGKEAVIGTGFSFQTIFFYGFVGLFMIYGVKASMKMGINAGAGGVAAGIWAKGKATTRFAGRATGVPGAYKEAKEYYGREGIPIGGGRRMFGTRQREELESKIAGGIFRVPGIAEKQLGRNVDAEIKRIKENGTHLDRDALERMINTGSPEQKIAAAQVFAEENYGALNPDQVTGLRGAFGKNANTSLAASVFRKQKWGDMSTDELNQFITPGNPNETIDPNIRSFVYNALIDKRRATPAQFLEALNRPNVSGAQRATMIAKAREMLGEDMATSDRNNLQNSLMATGGTPAAQAEAQRQNRDAIRELVKIRAQKGDEFFYTEINDPANPGTRILVPDQARLHDFATTYFEVPTERKKFLEDTAKKDAYSSAIEMLNQGMLRDDAGQVIRRAGWVDPNTGVALAADTHTNIEQLAIRQTIRKLSQEEKFTQHQAQHVQGPLSAGPNPLHPLQQGFLEDMTRNKASFQGYVGHEKYTAARSTFALIETAGRRLFFDRHYYEPFRQEFVAANRMLIDMDRTTYDSRIALTEALNNLRSHIREMREIRNNYERLCRDNGFTDPSDPSGRTLEPDIVTQLAEYDTRIRTIENGSARIANTKRPTR